MRLGILGFPKVGKTTMFNTLTSSARETDKFSASKEVNLGTARVPDARLEQLRDLFRPKKYSPATVDYVDIPGLRAGEGRDSLDLSRLRDVDALVHVVRAFDDPELPHPEGRVDPQRDVESLDLELIFADHDLVSRRLERLDKAAKRGLGADERRERELLAETVVPALEAERPLRGLELASDDEKLLRGYQLLSAKPMLVAVNVADDTVGSAAEAFVEPGENVEVVVVSAPIEEEISRLDAHDQLELLAELGLAEPSLDRLVRASYTLLGSISFFTVGEDEVRAWTIGRGATARQAARAIHSDIERGFIRAEVARWDDVVGLGSLAACRADGCLRLEGKDYRVADGEIVHFRFNV